MRIIAGAHRGTTLSALGKGDAAAHLRPTSDRVRESLFSMILSGAYGDPLTGARVLDLFAGTGALGLEALSRGARHATFVDDGRKAQGLIRENIRRLRREGDTTLLGRDAMRLPPNTDGANDLIFLDPPYGKSLGGRALATALSGGWIAPGALVIWEENTPQTAPEGFSPQTRRRYGDSWITILRADTGTT